MCAWEDGSTGARSSAGYLGYQPSGHAHIARAKAHLFLHMIKADVDGCVFGALAFILGCFLAGAEAGDGPRLGDGSEFVDGDD